MKQKYRISPKGQGPEPTDAELMRYRDNGRLLYNYQRAVGRLHRKPLYKDPKSFVVLLLIVLMAVLLAELSDRKSAEPSPADEQHP